MVTSISPETEEERIRKAYLALRLEREARLRLFQQLHQGLDPEDADRYDFFFRRANGSVLCEHCGLEYRVHPYDEEGPVNCDGRPCHHRLCGGETAHL